MSFIVVEDATFGLQRAPMFPITLGLANYWWQYISLIIEGKVSTQKGMDNFAIAIDKHLATIGKNSEMKCAPKLNPLSSKTFWLQQKGAPKQAIADKPIGYTLPYQEAINVWK